MNAIKHVFYFVIYILGPVGTTHITGVIILIDISDVSVSR